MTTRRGMFLTLAAVSVGAVGSAGGSATLANAAPERSPARSEAAVSGENQRLHAELEAEKKTVEVLAKLLRHFRAKVEPAANSASVMFRPLHLASSRDGRCVKCGGNFPCPGARRESEQHHAALMRQPPEAS
jgi:hypothetical protein